MRNESSAPTGRQKFILFGLLAGLVGGVCTDIIYNASQPPAAHAESAATPAAAVENKPSKHPYLFTPGDQVKLKFDAPGCRTLDDSDFYWRLLKAKDRVALVKMEHTRCPFIPETAELVIEQAPFSDSVCVRQTGEVDCAWVNRGWLVSR